MMKVPKWFHSYAKEVKEQNNGCETLIQAVAKIGRDHREDNRSEKEIMKEKLDEALQVTDDEDAKSAVRIGGMLLDEACNGNADVLSKVWNILLENGDEGSE